MGGMKSGTCNVSLCRTLQIPGRGLAFTLFVVETIAGLDVTLFVRETVTQGCREPPSGLYVDHALAAVQVNDDGSLEQVEIVQRKRCQPVGEAYLVGAGGGLR